MTRATKKVKLRLIGFDGNAFALMGTFQQRARREGWTRKEISDVLHDAVGGDYNHLLRVLSMHCV